LHNLANEIGSPVVLTNDMRLTGLAEREDPNAYNALNAVRTVSAICRWLIEGTSALTCPYAGCPGCPEERVSESCRSDARKVVALSDNVPWCTMFFSAKQLRVVELMRSVPGSASPDSAT
jgi:hypothetical protein